MPPENLAPPRDTNAAGALPGSVVIRARTGWVPIDLGELWRYRELIGFLALRDIQVRYKQTVLGAGWAVLQPVVTMVIFSVLFGLLLGRNNMPTAEGIPYPVSTYCALVPWQLFATSLISSGNSVVANQGLITKVYFPRMAAPIAPILAALVDFAIALTVLIGMMLVYGITPGPAILTLPLFAVLAIATALGVSLWLSALNAIYRDVKHILPFIAQAWMFLTPVLYTTRSILGDAPHWVHTLYGLNPMAGVVEGFRWALLGGVSPPPVILISSAAMVALLLVGGAFFFRRMERSFSDLV